MCGFLLLDGGTVHKPNFPWVFPTMEKEMATHSSIFDWRISWTEEPSGLQSMGSKRVRHDWSDLAWIPTMGHPLLYSCLENSMDREAWWATVHGGRTEWDMPEQLFGWLVSHRDSQCQSAFPAVEAALTLALWEGRVMGSFPPSTCPQRGSGCGLGTYLPEDDKRPTELWLLLLVLVSKSPIKPF